MRHAELLSETITNRPPDLKAWAARRAKTLRGIEAQEKVAHALMKGCSNSAWNMVEGFVRHSGLDGSLFQLEGLRLERYYEIDRMADALESVSRHGRSFMRYVASAVRDMKPLHDEYRDALALVPFIDTGMREYGYEPGGDYAYDEDYLPALNLTRGFKALAALVPLLDRVTADIGQKVALYDKMDGFVMDPHNYRPDHGEVETLYHATLHASDIERAGFSAERPDERLGVGNFGQQNLISFTSNLHVAHSILRAFRDLWLIAHGQLDMKTILGWMRAEKIDIVKARKSGECDDPRVSDSRVRAVRLYRIYQWMTKLRSNPVLVDVEKLMLSLADRKWDDIGILQCEVKLDDAVEYLVAEEEFRVGSERVVSVRRIL